MQYILSIRGKAPPESRVYQFPNLDPVIVRKVIPFTVPFNHGEKTWEEWREIVIGVLEKNEIDVDKLPRDSVLLVHQIRKLKGGIVKACFRWVVGG